MAFETDLLEYDDLFDGNPAVDAKVEALKAGTRQELAGLDGMGGAIKAIDYMKAQLVTSNAERLGRIEAGETVVVGVNKYTQTEPSPLMSADGGIMTGGSLPQRPNKSTASQNGGRTRRGCCSICSHGAARRRCQRREYHARLNRAAKAGATTGEWAAQMRAVHGEYRGPTGVSPSPSNKTEGLDDLRAAVDHVSTSWAAALPFSLASRVWTATAMAPNRSLIAPATAA